MLVQKPPGKTTRTPWMIDMEARLAAVESTLDTLQKSKILGFFIHWKLKNAENIKSKAEEK